MKKWDVVVVGGGISGISFGWKAARSGSSVLLLEAGSVTGGCLDSRRSAGGHWFEMGAHTTYNSYGGFLEIAEESGAGGRMIPRGEARKSFGLLRGGSYSWLTPPKLLLRFNWLEIAVNAPLGIFRKKAGRSMEGYFGGILGKGNYRKYLGPFLAAVPSQSADGFPADGAGSLFKKRPRREDVPRSFGFDGSLTTVCEEAVKVQGMTVRKDTEVRQVARDDTGFVVTTSGEDSIRCETVAVAAPVDVAARILKQDFSALAGTLEGVATVEVESVGVVPPRERCWMPEVAFLVPVDDIFWSAVTRDPFPHEKLRSFAFHFKPGYSRDEKMDRMQEILKVSPGDLGEPVERKRRIPAPAMGHDGIIASLDGNLAGGKLALTGNYFQGLAIEDCIQRSFAEWERVKRI